LNLIEGWQDAAVAFCRATALVGAPETGDVAWWAEKVPFDAGT
jgi:cytochrome c5